MLPLSRQRPRTGLARQRHERLWVPLTGIDRIVDTAMHAVEADDGCNARIAKRQRPARFPSSGKVTS